AAHRAADDDGPLQIERGPCRTDEGQIIMRRQSILSKPPTVGRVRTPVVGHVECDDAKPTRDLWVVQQVAILAAVRAGRVETQQWHAVARFLHVDSVGASLNIEIEVPTDDRL